MERNSIPRPQIPTASLLPSLDPTDPTPARTGEGALSPYLRAIQAHRLVFILAVAATVAASVVWISIAGKEYSATSQLLVTPLPQDDKTFLGFDVLRDSGDPTRTVQTAAALIETREAAERASEMLQNGGETGDQILDSVSVEPEGESNVLAVTATADSPQRAAAIANAFTTAALDIRGETLESQLEAEIERLRSGPLDSDSQNRIDTLERLQEQGDPTLALAQPAAPSDSPVGASAALIIGLALLAGLAIGTGASVLLELTARKLRDEEEAVRLYPLPILARVPKLSRQAMRHHSSGDWPMPPAVREQFRTLLAQIQSDRERRIVMFTSGSTGDGKTTSSVNLAMTMALAGHSTLLMDMDLRKPGVGETLNLKSAQPVSRILDPNTPIKDLLVPVPEVEELKMLAPIAVGEQDEMLIERLAEQLPEIIKRAAGSAEYVVVDTAPLGEVSDALRIAGHVDEVVLVVRPGNTNRANYEVMRDLLERSGKRPNGLLVIGDRTGATKSYYAYGAERERAGLGPFEPGRRG